MCKINYLTGEIDCYNNTFQSVAKDMFSSIEGLLMIFVPLIIFIAGFFLIKKYAIPSRKALILYVVVSLIIYVLLMYFFSTEFFFKY